MVNMISVSSSNLKAIGYEKETSKLYVDFLSNSTYVYFEVPEEEYQNLLNADSKGRYLNSKIKNNYAFEKIN